VDDNPSSGKLPPSRDQVHTERPDKEEGSGPQTQEQQYEDGGHLAACTQHHRARLRRRLRLLLRFVVMPLDGKEHAYAEHENLERNEDDREPIHHFEYFQAMT
jgi:hypothetical protein